MKKRIDNSSDLASKKLGIVKAAIQKGEGFNTGEFVSIGVGLARL